jgi:CDP-diglyceride synthetase
MTIKPEVLLRIKTGGALGVAFAALLLWAAYSSIGTAVLIAVGALAVGGAALEYTLFSARDLSLESKQERRVITLLTLGAPLVCTTVGALTLDLTPLHAVPELASRSIVIATCSACAALSFFGRRSLDHVSSLAASLLPMALLVGIGGSCLIALPASDLGVSKLTWLILVVCTNDIGAFFGGSRFKGPLLSPALSPKKTLSGSGCGFLAGITTGMITGGLFQFQGHAEDLLMVTIATVFAAQNGDLMKSFAKRLHQVKDSGTILPGHGGLLDRLDGMLAAAPIVLFFWT